MRPLSGIAPTGRSRVHGGLPPIASYCVCISAREPMRRAEPDGTHVEDASSMAPSSDVYSCPRWPTRDVHHAAVRLSLRASSPRPEIVVDEGILRPVATAPSTRYTGQTRSGRLVVRTRSAPPALGDDINGRRRLGTARPDVGCNAPQRIGLCASCCMISPPDRLALRRGSKFPRRPRARACRRSKMSRSEGVGGADRGFIPIFSRETLAIRPLPPWRAL